MRPMTTRMKISLLCPAVSTNALGRSHILARVLARRYDVEIVGPDFHGGVWAPLAGDSGSVRTVPMSPRPRGLASFPALRRLATGDVLYASKPLSTSFGVGLSVKYADGRPLVLDVDDWESGFARAHLEGLSPLRRLRYLAGSALLLHSPLSFVNTWLFERLIFAADAVTVSNRFLAARFGGSIVWHGRDAESLRPESIDGKKTRRRLGLPEEARVILFFGTARPYKGIEDLIEAVAGMRREDVVLALVGMDDGPSAHRAMARAEDVLGERCVARGPQPFEKIPEVLSCADVVAIPQRRSPATLGQLPAKLFDAMAMAKPIVATAVSDMPEILKECGWIAEPGNPRSLAEKIGEALDDRDAAETKAKRARNLFLARYSWDAMEETLAGILGRFE